MMDLHRSTREAYDAVTDLVIGALATETRALVWSLDADFERMGQIGLVRLYG
jgi:predicted nucleic acid-binding protein